MNYFLPRSVGCNRYDLFDIQGNYLRCEVREGFEFEDLEDLRSKLISLYGYSTSHIDDVEIDGQTVKAGLLIGWVKTYEEYVAALKEKERDKEISQKYWRSIGK
jgi:hypothetical protein